MRMSLAIPRANPRYLGGAAPSLTLTLCLSLVWSLPACDGHDEAQHTGAHDLVAKASDEGEEAKPLTNRLHVPSAVRANLGVVFQRAELRAVQRTLRLPGRFELRPTATRTAHAPLAGGVELAVRSLQRVDKDQLLATIRAPQLRERQHALHKAEHGIRRARAEVALLSAQLTAAKRELRFVQGRVARLGGASVRRASLDGEVLKAKSTVRMLTIRVRSARDEVDRERHHREVQLRELSDITGLTAQALAAPSKLPTDEHSGGGHRGNGHGRTPLWDTLAHVQLRAKQAGIVTRIAVKPGAWAARGAAVVDVTQDRALRFVATALQSDVSRLRDGASATLSPPSMRQPVRRGEVRIPAKASEGTVQLAVATDAGARTLPVVVHLAKVPPWARAGLVAYADVLVAGSSAPEVAIPRAAVVRDGLHDVFFLRDRSDPDQVIRIDAELGADDGTWVAVFSGVNAGDELVVEGAYELKLASSKRSEVKGHFHADGSFHPAGEK